MAPAKMRVEMGDARNHVMLCGLACLCAALWAPGCASPRSMRDLEAEKQRLQAENLQLRKDLTESRVRMRMAGIVVPDASQIPDTAQAGGAPAGRASTAPSVSDIAAPILQPEIESEAISATETDPLRGPGTAGGPALQGNPDALMQAGRSQLELRRADEALATFMDLSRRFPDSELADDAVQGAGDAYFQLARYEDAIVQYRQVAERFPHSDRVPWAFLQIGFAHLRMDQTERALDEFRTVSQAYPGTEAATVARQQIAHLRANPR